MKLKLHIFLLLFLTFWLASAQTARKYSNEFLNIGVDAAALGMSKSVVASSNDVNASYWNPAGLTMVNDYQGALMHASYFAGIGNYDYAAFAMPIDEKSGLGIYIIRFGVDDILDTTNLIDNDGNIDYNRIELFSAADYALNFAYARNIIAERLAIGFNVKVIHRIIGDFANSWGFGLDASLQFEQNNWKFGLMLRDITTTFNTWSFNEEKFEPIFNALPEGNKELPESTELTLPKAQLGAARNFNLSKDFDLLAEIDLNFRFAATNDIISSSFVSIDPSLGFQVAYSNIVFLRAGVGNFQQEVQFDNSKEVSVQPNFGVGFRYKGIQIDYALTNIASVGNVLYSNIFSIKLDFHHFK